MKLEMSENGFGTEINKEDYEMVSKIAGSNLFGIVGDKISFWRWQNAVKTFGRVKDICDKNRLEPKQVSPKFLSNFFEGASAENDEGLQDLWAKIYVGESTDDSSYSHRTLNALKAISSEEAQVFYSICPFLIQINGKMFLLDDSILFNQYDISFEKRSLLQDMGLLNEQPYLPIGFPLNSASQLLVQNGKSLVVLTDKTKQENHVMLKLYSLTTAGNELYHVVNNSENQDYSLSLGKKLQKANSNFKVTLHKIKSDLGGGFDIEEEDLLDMN